MRLDLFLKNTRLVKRRSSARNYARGGGVLVNGTPAKPGKDVKPGDVLTLLDMDEPPTRVEIVAEARRPVPRGREADFFRMVD